MTSPSTDHPSAARDLATHLHVLLRREQSALAEFLLVLAEFDRQRGWRALGYAGLFPFLHRELRLSKAASYFRKTAADLVQRFPEIMEPIRDGRLCLTSVVELSKVVTAENKDAVLPRFFHCSKQEAKAVSAELRPDEHPVQRTVVTAVPASTSAPLTLAISCSAVPDRTSTEAGPEPRNGMASPAETKSRTVRPGEPVRLEVTATGLPRDEEVPLTADLRRLHITVSRRFLEKLDAARSALSHSHPGATKEGILEAALDLVLAKDARRKGLTRSPRPGGPPPPPGSRYVPAAVRRAVWKRDGGRCQWPLESGGICGSTFQVELDHVHPVGQGGRPAVETMRLLCKPHNDLAARLAYGDAWMDRYTSRMGRVAPREPPGEACSGSSAPARPP